MIRNGHIFSPSRIVFVLNVILALLIAGFITKSVLDLKSRAAGAVENGTRFTFQIETEKVTAAPEGKFKPGEAAKKDQEQKPVEIKQESAQNLPEPKNEMEARLIEAGLTPLKVADEFASLPKIGKDPFSEENAIATPLRPDARAGIILKNLGLDENVMARAYELPSHVAFSFSPYSKNLSDYVKRAAILGHDVYLDLPAQTEKYPLEDPGPYGILIDKTEEENKQRLKDQLKSIEGLKGLVLPINEDLTVRKPIIKPILDAMKENRLSLVFRDKPGNRFLRGDNNQGLDGMKLYPQYTIIGLEHTQEAIDGNFMKAHARMGEKAGDQLILVEASLLTIHRLDSWLKLMRKFNGQTVPVSDLKISFD